MLISGSNSFRAKSCALYRTAYTAFRLSFSKVLSEPMSKIDTIKEYQDKRSIFMKIIPTCFVIFFVSVGVVFFTDYEVIPAVLAFGSGIVAITTQMTINKCPNCGRVQLGTVTVKDKIIRTERWALNPMTCPWCKVKLNKPHRFR